jgi:hypothetical protein
MPNHFPDLPFWFATEASNDAWDKVIESASFGNEPDKDAIRDICQVIGELAYRIEKLEEQLSSQQPS